MEFWLLPSRARLDAAIPEFARWLNRAESLGDVGRGLDAALVPWGFAAPIPWAALLVGRTGPAAHTHDWLIADLVSMHAEANTARILSLAAYSLSAEACAALGAAVQPWFEDEGFEWHACGPGRWLLRCPTSTPSPGTVALDQALGVDLREITPRVREWQRRDNEMQIVLTQQTLNQSRLAQGAPAFNALWVWGFGRLPFSAQPRFQSVASQDPALTALASFCKLPEVDLSRRGGSMALRDLRNADDLARACSAGLRPHHAELRLADGTGYRTSRLDKLRFWR